jgi:hypothetical protein
MVKTSEWDQEAAAMKCPIGLFCSYEAEARRRVVWHGYMELVSSERGFQVFGRTVYFANVKVGMREEALVWGVAV